MDVIFYIGIFVAIVLILSIINTVVLKPNESFHKSTKSAVVVSKRTSTSGRGGKYNRIKTLYFVTFELDDKSRLEIKLEGKQSGLVVEGDRVLITVYGSEKIGYKRLIKIEAMK